MTKKEIKKELKKLGFKSKFSDVYELFISKGLDMSLTVTDYPFIFGETVTVRFMGDEYLTGNFVKFSSSRCDGVSICGVNGGELPIQFLNKESLIGSLKKVCEKIENIVRENKLKKIL